MKCGYCFGAVDGLKSPRCWSCESSHHRDCWIENGGCVQFGCPGGVQDDDSAALASSGQTSPGEFGFRQNEVQSNGANAINWPGEQNRW